MEGQSRNMSQNVVILGSTGSIGESALQVAAHLGDAVRIVGLAAGSRSERLAEQVAEFGCKWAYIADPEKARGLGARLPDGCRAVQTDRTLCELVAAPDVDIVLCAIVGTAGLRPVLAAIEAGKDIALASKEVLVMAGATVMDCVRRQGVRLLPVDSEHCALFQCLDQKPSAEISRLILTASGGPFRGASADDLCAVTPEQALAHPTWNMGRKITIDSATLMNKGLELIEAHWLFGVAPDTLDVVVHPQSIVHSMVEFVDGSILAQMGLPDMRLPIQYCLTYPKRCPSLQRPMPFDEALTLDFEPPDVQNFPALRLAKDAICAGGTMPAVFNAANEVAVDAFCHDNCSFPGISCTVDAVMQAHDILPASGLDSILAADAWARRYATECLGVVNR